MKLSQFIGREVEMARLEGLLDKKSASLIVVRGRRRIGKSRLLAEFGKEMKSYFFSGNPPNRTTTAQTQRNDFVGQLERVGIVGIKADDWSNLYRSNIEKEVFSSLFTQLPEWEEIMGLQFENLVVHNRKILWKLLGISPQEIVMEGPFFQSPTTKHVGCQIDYMIQTRFHNLYICEIKFSKNPIGNKIIQEMEKKRRGLKVPKNCSIRPVLIHVNGVEESVLDERYFDKIVDFGELL